MRPVRLVIQCRLGSVRLPAKALLQVAGTAAVVLCARRAGNTGREVVVATGEEPANDPVAQAVSAAGLRVVRGPEDDVLGRFINAIKDLPDEAVIVRMTADNLLPDGALVDEMVEAFLRQPTDYLAPAFPDDGLPYGVIAEVVTAGHLRQAHREATSTEDREHVMPWIRRHGLTARFVSAQTSATWKGLRATMDTLGDFQRMSRVFMGVEDPVRVSWRALCDRLEALDEPIRRATPEFILGLANWGLTGYGLAGRPFALADSLALLKGAAARGVGAFDCAQAYGEAETVMGQVLPTTPDLRVFTKLGPLEELDEQAARREVDAVVEAAVWRSCARLGLSKIPILLLHRAAHLAGPVWDRLLHLQKDGVIGELGVSVYTPEEAREALGHAEVRHLQVPVNILDRRWAQAALEDVFLSRPDVSVMARSVFLQGILTATPGGGPALPEVDLAGWQNRLGALAETFARSNRADLCLAYVRSLPWVRGIVLGVDSLVQLDELLALYTTPALTPAQRAEAESALNNAPETLLDPRQWPRQ